MPVHIDQDGRRWVSAETEVTGTPDVVWRLLPPDRGSHRGLSPVPMSGESGAWQTISHFRYPDGSMDSVAEVKVWDLAASFTWHWLSAPIDMGAGSHTWPPSGTSRRTRPNNPASCGSGAKLVRRCGRVGCPVRAAPLTAGCRSSALLARPPGLLRRAATASGLQVMGTSGGNQGRGLRSDSWRNSGSVRWPEGGAQVHCCTVARWTRPGRWPGPHSPPSLGEGTAADRARCARRRGCAFRLAATDGTDLSR